MKTRTAALGIVAAAIGGFAATVGVVLATKPGAKGSAPASSGDDEAVAVAPPEPLAAIAAEPQAAGPSGPVAHRTEAPRGDEGHAAPDLAGGADVGSAHRAPEAFRPDMDAPMTAAEREALRPATGPAPSLVGGSTSQPSGSGD